MNVLATGDVERGLGPFVHDQYLTARIQHQLTLDHAAQDGIGLILFRDHLGKIFADLLAHIVEVLFKPGNLVCAAIRKKVVRKRAAGYFSRKLHQALKTAAEMTRKSPRPEEPEGGGQRQSRQKRVTKRGNKAFDVPGRHGVADDSFLPGAGLMVGTEVDVL